MVLYINDKTYLKFGVQMLQISQTLGGEWALLVEMCITTFDYFASFVLRLVITLVLCNHIMRNNNIFIDRIHI